MRSPAYRLMFGAALTVLLAACTIASAPVASPTSVAEDRSAPTPLASVAVLQQTTAPPLLLVDLNRASPGQASGLRMRPVDPATPMPAPEMRGSGQQGGAVAPSSVAEQQRKRVE